MQEDDGGRGPLQLRDPPAPPSSEARRLGHLAESTGVEDLHSAFDYAANGPPMRAILVHERP